MDSSDRKNLDTPLNMINKYGETLFKLERTSRPFLYGFLMIIAAKVFQKSDYSQLAFLNLFYTTFAVFSTLGIEGIVRRDIKKNSKVTVEYTLEQLFFTRNLITSILLVIAYFILIIINKKLPNILVLLPILFFQSFDLYEWVLIAKNKYNMVFSARSISTLITCAIKILALIKSNILLFIGAHLFEYFYLLIRYFAYSQISLNLRKLSFFLNAEIIWYFLSILVIVALSKVDQYAVSFFLGLEDLATYSLAAYFIQVPLVFMTNIYIKDYNFLVRLDKESYRFEKYFKMYAKKIFFTSLLIWVLIYLGSYFVEALLKDKYPDLGLITRILSFIIIINSIAMTHAPYWLVNRMAHVIFKLSLVNLLISIIFYTLFGHYLALVQFAVLSVLLILLGNIFTPFVFRGGRSMNQMIFSAIFRR
jgi:O-antigen/teichoic acid export membrane protein